MTTSSSLARRSAGISTCGRSGAATITSSCRILGVHRLGQPGVGRTQRGRENRAVGETDAGDVVAHVVQRGAADAGFAAIGLALADLIGQPHGAIQQTLRGERHAIELAVQTVQMPDQFVDVGQGIGAAGAEQFCFDGMEATDGIGPGVDLRVEFRNKSRGEDFGSLPTRTCRNPGLLRAGKVVRRDALAKIARARQCLTDAFDHIRPILLRRVIERRGNCCAQTDPQRQQHQTGSRPHPDHALEIPSRNRSAIAKCFAAILSASSTVL